MRTKVAEEVERCPPSEKRLQGQCGRRDGRRAFIFREKHWLMGKLSTVIEAVRGASKTRQTAEAIRVQHIWDSCHIVMIQRANMRPGICLG